jgi:predicted Ser/Thr protein kinase
MSPKKLGRYDLLRVLGKGAMGLVYEGRDPNLDRRVAIKTIKVENLSEEAAAEYEVRFRTEARSAARLQHPNIVSVYDSDRDGDVAFLVMEFIQGDDLKHHLDQGERHTLEQTLAIMSDLLAALDYAHRQNIVHRDIKPANLLIEASGRVKLTDFGVARIQDSGDATRTQGSMVGTLKYMSPEQVQGQPIDARADLFAAGVVLYQLLTGKRPFDGDSDFAIIQQIVAQDPPSPSSFNSKLPAAMDAVVARALAKSRERRFASGLEFSAALQSAARQASDPTAIAPAAPAVSAKNATWTRTMRAGESLVDTQSGLGTNGSAVAQELELVYWKDVKDSTDVEDLQGFLDRFPGGIYTDLARRRMRKLGLPAGEDSGVGSKSGITHLDKTMLLPKELAQPVTEPVPGTVDSAWNALGEAAERVSAPQVLQARPKTSTAADVPPAVADTAGDGQRVEPPAAAINPAAATLRMPPTAPPKSRRLVWALAGIVVLAGAGFVFNRMPTADQSTTQSAAAEATAPTIASAASAPSLVVVAPVVAAPSPESAYAKPAVASAVSSTSAVVATAAPVSAAVSSASSAKKATGDKDRLAKLAPAKGTASSATGGSTGPTVTTGATASVRPVVASESPRTTRVSSASPNVTVAAANPRQACEGRVLLGFQSCMAEQCAKPIFASNAECVERRAMEQRRRDDEQSRR